MVEKTAADLLMAIGETMSAEEMMLLSLQGMIAAEVEMKRTELQMNQKQFAQYMGVTQATVSKWESGDTNFTLSTLVHIASKLGLKMQSPFEPKERKAKSASVKANTSETNVYIVDFRSAVSGMTALSGSIHNEYQSIESDKLKEKRNARRQRRNVQLCKCSPVHAESE